MDCLRAPCLAKNERFASTKRTLLVCGLSVDLSTDSPQTVYRQSTDTLQSIYRHTTDSHGWGVFGGSSVRARDQELAGARHQYRIACVWLVAVAVAAVDTDGAASAVDCLSTVCASSLQTIDRESTDSLQRSRVRIVIFRRAPHEN